MMSQLLEGWTSGQLEGQKRSGGRIG